jgi:hypothetical protein
MAVDEHAGKEYLFFPKHQTESLIMPFYKRNILLGLKNKRQN